MEYTHDPVTNILRGCIKHNIAPVETTVLYCIVEVYSTTSLYKGVRKFYSTREIHSTELHQS